MSALTITLKGDCPGADLLLLLRHDLLDAEDGRDELRAHLEACATCQARDAALSESLAEPELAFEPADPAEFAALQARIEAADAEAAAAANAGPALTVRLRCTYCRDDLSAGARYCASCLAPHHGDCFETHGRCAAPGCEGKAMVASDAPVKKPRSRLFPFLFGIVFAGGAVAALSSAERGLQVSDAKAVGRPADSPPPPASGAALELQAYPVRDLLFQSDGELAGESLRQRLAGRKVTLNFPDTSAAVVAEFLRDILGVKAEVAASLRAKTVSLRLKDIAVEAALELIATQVGAHVRYEAEGIRFVEKTAARFSSTLPSEISSEAARDEASARLVAKARAVVEAALGAEAWASPAQIELVREVLVVRQSRAAHDVLSAWLQERRRSKSGALQIPASLKGAWFLPGAPQELPARERERAHSQRLRTARTVGSEGSLLDVVQAEVAAAKLPLRVDGDVRERLKKPARTSEGALLTVTLAQLLGGVDAAFDVDRRGIRVRLPTSKPLEAGLALLARAPVAGTDPGNDEVTLRLDEQTIQLVPGARTLKAFLDWVRDLTGLSVVRHAGAWDLSVTLPGGVKTVRAALEETLHPHGLAIQVSRGVVVVVAADAGGDARARSLERFLEAPLGKAVSGKLADVVRAFEQQHDLDVVVGGLSAPLSQPVRLPAGVSMQEALTLLQRQLALRRVGWHVIGERKVLLLRAYAAPGLTRCLEALALPTWISEFGAPIRREVERSQAQLEEALVKLARSGQAPAEAFNGVLSKLGSAYEQAMEQREALRTLRRRTDPVVSYRGKQVFAKWQRETEELWELRAKSKAADEAARREFAVSELEEQRARVAYHEQAEAKKSGEAALAELRELNLAWRNARDRHDRLQKANASARRDAMLEIARKDSQAAQLLDELVRLGEARLVTRALIRARARLEGGEPWAKVFKRGYRTWLRAQRQGAYVGLRAGCSTHAKLRVTLEAGSMLVKRSQHESLLVGDRLVEPKDVYGWLERLTGAEDAGARVRVRRQGAELEVVVHAR